MTGKRDTKYISICIYMCVCVCVCVYICMHIHVVFGIFKIILKYCIYFFVI